MYRTRGKTMEETDWGSGNDSLGETRTDAPKRKARTRQDLDDCPQLGRSAELDSYRTLQDTNFTRTLSDGKLQRFGRQGKHRWHQSPTYLSLSKLHNPDMR